MARQTRILVVEDDPKTGDLIRLYLEHEGFAVDSATDGRRGLELARGGAHALAVLDVMLPELDGVTLCAELRRESDLPVLMLTARTSVDDRLEGLGAGADDYLAKPFSPRELVLRVRAILRRARGEAPGVERIASGDIVLDLSARTASVAGCAVPLTANEFELLRMFVRSPGRVFTREDLVLRAFGDDYDGLARTVDVHVKNLRKKIERDREKPERIVTVFGVGYRFAG